MDGATLANAWVLAIVVVTAGVATALTIWSIRRATTGPATPGIALGRGEKAVVSLIGAGGLVAVPLSVIGLITSAVAIATPPAVRVSGIPLAGGEYPPFLVASDAPVDAGYESAWVEVANLPGGVRALLWTADALPLLAGLVIGVGVAWLAIALLRGAPFARALPIVLGIVAIAVIAAGLGRQVLEAIARGETVAFLGAPQDITGPGGFAAFSLGLDLGPLGWGLGIALLAAAFSIGTRMQRDSAGLV